MEIKKTKGFSLIEILVAMGLFAVITVVATQSFANTIRSSKKSESISRIRENVNYAISSMERLLRNAQDITSCSVTQLDYIDEYTRPGRFTCDTAGGYIASGSATPLRMTSPDVRIVCNDPLNPAFQCPVALPGSPESVTITLRAEDSVLGGGTEGAVVTSKTKVLLRTYRGF